MTNTLPNPRIQASPKITEADITALTHQNDQHIGKSKHFNEVLQFLVSLGAFGYNVKAHTVADLLYEESSLLEPTPKQDKAGKAATHWGNRRFEKIRYGKASFTNQEADYFHKVFGSCLGQEWAELISADELVLNPLHLTLNKLRQFSLPGPWEQLDPIKALHLLASSQPKQQGVFQITINLTETIRISKLGDGLTEHLIPIMSYPILPVGTKYILEITKCTESNSIDASKTVMQYLVFEYAVIPLQDPNTQQIIQGQRLTNFTLNEERVCIRGEQDQPLQIEPHPGLFGFCVLACPQNWNLKEAFNLPDSGLLSVNTMQTLVKRIRDYQLQEKNLGITLYDYVVPAHT